MNLTRVKLECRRLVEDLVDYLELPEEIVNDIYIAGGAIRSMILDEEIKDVDIFFKTKNSYEHIKNLQVGFLTNNARTIYVEGLQYQLIITDNDIPYDLVNRFDFTMNSNYYDYSRDEIFVKDLCSIQNKWLVINKLCRNKLGTLARLFKFMERGYKITDRLTLLELGVALTKCEPVFTFEELEEESKLFFSEDEFNNINFVLKPLDEVREYADGFTPLGFTEEVSGYSKTLSGQCKLKGSAV